MTRLFEHADRHRLASRLQDTVRSASTARSGQLSVPGTRQGARRDLQLAGRVRGTDRTPLERSQLIEARRRALVGNESAHERELRQRARLQAAAQEVTRQARESVRNDQSLLHSTGRQNPVSLPTPPHDGDPARTPADALSQETSVARDAVPQRWPYNRPRQTARRSDIPINGLGDRNRSPTPADGWEVMRSTITPDASLPSADSSFTSTAASRSFTARGRGDAMLDAVYRSESPRMPWHGDDESSSTADPDESEADDEETEVTALFAQDVFNDELTTAMGRSRIERQRALVAQEGSSYSLHGESEGVEIGFRLINEALDCDEGRARILALIHNGGRPSNITIEDWVFGARNNPNSTARPNAADDELPTPRPERYGEETQAAVREATDQVHDYFNRFTADSLAHSTSQAQGQAERRSPPPRYEPLAAHPNVNTFTSPDSPIAYPVSPPSTRVTHDIADVLLDGDNHDLNAVRRVVERLAQRDDVPDEWWMSMGLNLSRTRTTRTRSRTPPAAAILHPMRTAP